MKTFEECCEYLGIPTDLPKCYIRERQLQAAYKLSVCIMAWNKQDGFEPDETARYHQKDAGYTPNFYHKDGRLLSSGHAYSGSYSGLVSASASSAAAYSSASVGLRLCLKTRDRAVEFGEVSIETFNELI